MKNEISISERAMHVQGLSTAINHLASTMELDDSRMRNAITSLIDLLESQSQILSDCIDGMK